ncbi:MAG: carboxymuconolactone decarboxylase family protein, partial [Conexibacter sp.]
ADRYAAGLAMRRRVHGDAHVDAALAKATDFDREFQVLVTEYCWAGIWAREGLDVRSRSLLNVGMLAAMGRWTQFADHVRSALRNGLSEAELREALMQIGAYCGIPAGMEAFRIAREVLAERAGDGAGR